MAEQNGHDYVNAQTRDVMMAATLNALCDLLQIKVSSGEHPLKPGIMLFRVDVGQVYAAREESKFKLANHPAGEIPLTAAIFGVLLKTALETHFHSQAATFLQPWINHTADCDVRAHGMDGPQACTCNLDQVIVKAAPSSAIEVSGG